MLKLLTRAISGLEHRLVLLAPPNRAVPDAFSFCDFDETRHREMMRAVQRVRGSIYLRDGAIESAQLSADGLHITPEDESAWHLLILDDQGDVTSCAWFREHESCAHYSRLRLRHCPLASSPDWADRLWRAVTDDMTRAQELGMRYAEVGGWAVAIEQRRTAEPILLALATYALARICGGALTVTTATTRHKSSDILQKIGGRPIAVGDGETLPRYYDPRYRCQMELLRFDSNAPDPRFMPLVEMLEATLSDGSVVARPYWPMMRERRLVPRVAATSPQTVPAELLAAANAAM